MFTDVKHKTASSLMIIIVAYLQMHIEPLIHKDNGLSSLLVVHLIEISISLHRHSSLWTYAVAK